MRILLIITDYGSFNNFLGDLSVDMVSKGHDVHVICSKEKIIIREDRFPYEEIGIKLHFVPFPRGFNFLRLYKSSKIIHNYINTIGPDLINIHFSTACFTTLFLRKCNVLTLGTFHGLGYTVATSARKKFIFFFIEKFCFLRLDQIWLLNDFDYRIVRKSHPRKTFLYTSLGLGCEPDIFSKNMFSEQDDFELRKELKIENCDFVLTYTGRFVEFKGYDLVIKAFNLICNYHSELKIKLILIGGLDPLHPSGLTNEEELNLMNNPNIIFIGFTNKVNKYLSITDVFVFPSLKEGIPVCILESLSMGVPVITSGARGCVDLVKHGYTGIVLSPRPSVNELYESILEMYLRSDLLAKFRENILSERALYDRRNYIVEQQEIYARLMVN